MTDLPVVFVHGMRISGAAWSAHLACLPGPAVAPDLPGHGARRGERFTFATEAIAAAVDEVGGRALVVGHSLGGYAAIAAAARYPARVAGLMVVGATSASRLTMPLRWAHALLSRLPDGGDRLSKWIFRAVLPPRVAAGVVSGGVATEVLPDLAMAARGQDPIADLRRYPGPVWLVNGARDHFRAHERRFLAACADGRLLVVPGAGHYLPLTQPETFTRLVLDAASAVRTSISNCSARR